MCYLVIFRFIQLLQQFQNIVVSDIIKRHTVNKDIHVCIEMHGVAHGFPVREIGEGPVRASSSAEQLYHT